MHYKNEDKDRWYLFWLKKAAQIGEEEALEMLEIHEAFEHARMTFVPSGNDEGGTE